MRHRTGLVPWLGPLLATLLTWPASAQDQPRNLAACLAIPPQAEPQRAYHTCNRVTDTQNLSAQDQGMLYESLGLSARALGRIPESLRHLERAAALRPDDTGLLRMLAWSYREAGNPTQAIALYTEVLKTDDHWQGWLSRCVAHTDLEHWHAAITDCSEALNRWPDNTDALFFRAYAHNYTGNGLAARKDAARGLKLAPDDPRFDAEMAWALHNLGSPTAARAYAQLALEDHPKDPGLLSYLNTPK